VRESGLTLPEGFKYGERVPVVIQASHYKPELFLPDGPNHPVDAAQALDFEMLVEAADLDRTDALLRQLFTDKSSPIE
jgi:hypothetical protein